MHARDPDGNARRPSKAAVISIMLFVVSTRPPLYSSTIPSSILPAQQRSPPARAGIALAGAVGPDEHLTRGGYRHVAGQRLGSPTWARGHGTAFKQPSSSEVSTAGSVHMTSRRSSIAALAARARSLLAPCDDHDRSGRLSILTRWVANQPDTDDASLPRMRSCPRCLRTANVLNRYAEFLALFGDFAGYVEFFLLQDAVEAYGSVRFFITFDDFRSSAVPQDIATYTDYQRRSIEFIQARNLRIADYTTLHTIATADDVA